ncbi:MAG: helix-turn-helix domain-containing protein [Patescibacteria group bacterium]|nr:helix-turn-helix domain-containing protein [Patescibacteria group bacterium]
MIETILQKFGLSDKEIKIYMTSIKIGPASVRRLAGAAGVNRGTAYDILKSLVESGLISYYHKEKNQYFIAEDPSKLKDVLEYKQQQLEKMKGEVDDIIPQLRSIYDNANAKPVVKFYEGLTGIKTILADVIDSVSRQDKKVYYAFSSADIKNYLYAAYPSYSDDRIEAGVNVKVISLGPGGEMRGLDERKWLIKDNSAPTYTLIYSGKVAMISVDKDDKPIGVLIEDKNIYDTQKITFELIWEKL